MSIFFNLNHSPLKARLNKKYFSLTALQVNIRKQEGTSTDGLGPSVEPLRKGVPV
jgi:hypothetical protein